MSVDSVFQNAHGEATGERLALTPFYTYASLDDLRGFVARARKGSADDASILAALTYDYKKAVPASPSTPPAGPTPFVPVPLPDPTPTPHP